MGEQYIRWAYYCAGIFMGFWNAIMFAKQGATVDLISGAALAIVLLVILWAITWIMGFKIIRRDKS